MATTTQLNHQASLTAIDLCPLPVSSTTNKSGDGIATPIQPIRRQNLSTDADDFASSSDLFTTTAIPDGGYGWIVVFCGATVTFSMNGMLNCWGILQTALLNSTLSHVPASTLAFIGSLTLCCGVAFGLISTRLAHQYGSRAATMTGITGMGLGLIIAGWCTESVLGLFLTIGLLAGVSMSAVYASTNALPVQYFSGKLGLANGLVKLGGGIGGTVMAIALEALLTRVGISWTFRTQGLITLATGLPAAWFMRDRVSSSNTGRPSIDLSMFRSVPFVAIFAAGAVGTFALFVPPYYLPLFAQSLGLSSSTGAGLVAAFNACNALGRFAAGPLSDKIGGTNTFVMAMLLNALTMLAVWPVSSTLAPLIIFAILNGMANGAFFTTFPTVVASIFGPGRAAMAMSTSITGWTGGYLLGAPIAGYLLQVGAGGKASEQQPGVEMYRPAIFYAGGVAALSSLFALWARFTMSKEVCKRI